MSELNVTPGEWVARFDHVCNDGALEISIKDNPNHIICMDIQNIENAHLMAASKELYEALVIAREYASEEIARRQDAGMDTSLDVGYLKQIDAALAKARGEAGDE